MQAEAEHIKRAESLQSEEDQQSKINSRQRKALNNIHQFMIPTHMLNRRRSAHKRSTETAKTKEATDFSKSEAEMVDVVDHTSARDFNH